ncbi:peptidoglycan-binding protein [Chelativorans sp. YIM 93263]|uniref:peptidoglycan-binding protein n=1 Tax=Chelativorans sp. YIM 93263 TaxID=2906648 RepID=UPI0023784A98|nr:peptidoglycan-binding protein [Chelativorans sp. YIM 93263]
MNSKRSQLDPLTTGRQRSGSAFEEINRTLDNLAERLESALESRESTPRSSGAERKPLTARVGGEDLPRATLERIAAEVEALRHRDGESVSAEKLSNELNTLREDVQAMVNFGVRREIGALREEIASLLANIPAAFVSPELSAEFDRLSAAISRLAERSDDKNAKVLRLELEQVRSALTELLRDDAPPAKGQEDISDTAMGRLHSRIEDISAAIGKLPDTKSLRTLEDKVGELSKSLVQFAETHTPDQSDLHTLIEERLDEISRAITASTAVIRSQSVDPAPLERVEARIASLASQIDELVQEKSGSVIVERLNTLSDRVDEIAQQTGVPEQLVEHLTGHIAELSRKLDSVPHERESELMAALENRFSELFVHLEKRQDEAFHQEQSQFEALQARLGEVIERLDQPGESEPGLGEALDKRFNELSERIEALREATQDNPELRALQARLDEIAARLQEEPQPVSGIDLGMIQNLEAQISALAGQLASTDSQAATGEAIAPRLENIEHSISAYHAEMLEAARQAAEQAVRKTSEKADTRNDSQLTEELQKLEALTRKSDERNARTFEAVHDTLLKIVARLGELEAGGKAEAVADRNVAVESTPSIDPYEGFSDEDTAAFEEEFHQRSPAEAAAKAAEAALREDDEAAPSKNTMLGGLSKALSGQSEADSEVDADFEVDAEPEEPLTMETGETDWTYEETAPEPEIDPERINEPLEPGSGAPDLNAILRRVRDEGDEAEKSETDTAQSDFVAAARRAAKAAAAEAEISKQNRSTSAEKGRKSGLGGLFRRRNKALLTLTGIAILAGSGVYFGKSMLPDSLQKAFVSGTDAPAEETEISQEEPTEADRTVQAEPASIEQDETVTGTIPEQSTPVRQAVPQAADSTGPDPLSTASKPPAGLDSVPPASITAASLRQDESADAPVESVTAIPVIPEEIGPAALRHAAAGGNPEALFEIAQRYSNGEGVEADLAEAAEWYRLSAERGLAPAQYRLGNIHEKGLGVDRDIEEAKTWYLKAAKQGNASAMHNLGVLFAVGTNGSADNDSAARWFLKAAELGVPDSQVNVGILSAKGVGMPRDLAEAYKWFAIAAESGDGDAAAKRDEIASAVPEEELERAKAKAELWQAHEADAQANVVDIPAAWKLDRESTAGVDMKRAITNVQLILNNAGFDAGPPDGIMGEKTRTAIKTFQEQNNLKATGEIDEALVRALLEQNESNG